MKSRRDFLSSIVGTGICTLGLSGTSRLESMLPKDGIKIDSTTADLIKLLEDAPREGVQAVLVQQLKKGVPYRKILEATFLYPILWQAHHSVYIVHSAHQHSLDIPAQDRMLPLFWATDVMKRSLERPGNKKVSPLKGKIPSPTQAVAEFDAAMKAMEFERAERAVIGLSRVIGPKQTYSRLLPYACRDMSFIGHIPIAISNAGRLLPVIGWQHAEVVLRYIVHEMFGRHLFALDKQPYRHNVERAEKDLASLPVNWTSDRSNEEKVLEIFESIRRGKWWVTNELIVKLMQSGEITAGTAWDAVHLGCADLMICHKEGGYRLGNRALHSNTVANALHFSFRTMRDPMAQLVTLFQAVSYAVEFRENERNRDSIRDVKITDFEAENLNSPDETVEAIFDAMPPRILMKETDDRSGIDKAASLTFSLASQISDRPILLGAMRQAMTKKISVDAHELKFPVAMFEDMNYVSPKWRPHLLAATVVFLQGAKSEDNPAVKRGVDLMRG